MISSFNDNAGGSDVSDAKTWCGYWISKCGVMFQFNQGKIFGFAKLILCQEMFCCWKTWEVLPASRFYSFWSSLGIVQGTKLSIFSNQYKCINLLVNSHYFRDTRIFLLSWLLCKKQAQCNLNFISSYSTSLTLSMLFNIFLQIPRGKGYAWVRVSHIHHCHVGRYSFLDRRWLLFGLDNKKLHTFTSIFHTSS